MRTALLCLVAFVALSACSADDEFLLSIGDITLTVEIADTEESRSLGLMYRESMDEDHGMLFVFQDSEPRAFYMRNTEIPLSIAFIDERRVIREIHDMEPFSLESVFSRNPAMYALEVNQGVFERFGITPGDRLSFSVELSERLNE